MAGASDSDSGPGVRRLGQQFLLSSHPRVWFPHLHRRGLWSLTSVRNFLDAHTRLSFLPMQGDLLTPREGVLVLPPYRMWSWDSVGEALSTRPCWAALGQLQRWAFIIWLHLAVARPCSNKEKYPAGVPPWRRTRPLTGFLSSRVISKLTSCRKRPVCIFYHRPFLLGPQHRAGSEVLGSILLSTPDDASSCAWFTPPLTL